MELIRAGVRSGRGARSISHRPVPPQQKSDNNTLTSGSIRLVEQRIDARVDTRCSPCLPSAGARARHLSRRRPGSAPAGLPDLRYAMYGVRYDIDTPITLTGLQAAGEVAYVRADQVPLVEVYFSFTGGPALAALSTR